MPELPFDEPTEALTAAEPGDWVEPITLDLFPRTDPMSLNEALEGKTAGANAKRARFIKDWRTAGYKAAALAGAHRTIAGRPGHVWLVVTFPVNRRRDDMNYTLALKAVVDGLVEAGCWDDDQRDTVVTWGVRWEKSPQPHRIVISPANHFSCVHDANDHLDTAP